MGGTKVKKHPLEDSLKVWVCIVWGYKILRPKVSRGATWTRGVSMENRNVCVDDISHLTHKRVRSLRISLLYIHSITGRVAWFSTSSIHTNMYLPRLAHATWTEDCDGATNVVGSVSYCPLDESCLLKVQAPIQ